MGAQNVLISDTQPMMGGTTYTSGSNYNTGMADTTGLAGTGGQFIDQT